MSDQDVIARLLELHDHIQAPATPVGEDALRGKQLARRRRVISAAAVAAGVVLTGGVLQKSPPSDSSELQPAPAPSSTAPSSVAPSDSVEPLRIKGDAFATKFNKIVAQVPDWFIADDQQMFTLEPCAGDWSSTAMGSRGGNFDVRVNGQSGQVMHIRMGFASTAQASAAVDRFVRNLESCDEVAWHTQPIDQTGGLLASSAYGLVWVQQNSKELSTIDAVTDAGPPPPAVVTAIGELMRSHLAQRDD